LEEPLYDALRKKAFDRASSIAAVVRDAIRQYLGHGDGRKRLVEGNPKPLPPLERLSFIAKKPAAKRGFGWVGIGRSKQNPKRPVSIYHDDAFVEAYEASHKKK